ncbi:hypothetical protein PG994_000694 [Apiospora phragmitis]|uniref:NAD(P)-binding protein n=1 Tax=Apiospora phragmitis TaxID=2905665 RepID=A0ABR1X771_9PEZI
MSLCRAAIRRLPVCRPIPTGAASLCGGRPSNSLTPKRAFHAAPLLNKKQANPETKEEEKFKPIEKEEFNPSEKVKSTKKEKAKSTKKEKAKPNEKEKAKPSEKKKAKTSEKVKPITKEKVKPSEEEKAKPTKKKKVGPNPYAEFELTGKVFVVTGGTYDLGLVLAEALAEAGEKGLTAVIAVYCIDTTPEPGNYFLLTQKRVVPEWGGSLHYRQHDVFDPEHLNQLIQAIAEGNGRLDGLVATAPIQHVTLETEFIRDEAHDMTTVSFRGVREACTAAARQMTKRKTGPTVAGVRRVQGGADAAHARAGDGMEPHAPSDQKGGGGGGGDGCIRVNCIGPGLILQLGKKIIFERFKRIREKWEREDMMGRAAEPSQFRAAVLFLSSKASFPMTSGNIEIVDGDMQIY